MQGVDALGRPLTAANRRGVRKGQRPPNFGRTFRAEVLSTDEMHRLLDAALHPSNAGGNYVPPSATRNHAILTVLWRAGLRSGEMRALFPRDVNLPARTITVNKSKTAAGLRMVGIDEVAAESLERWLSVRAGLGVGNSSPVFCTVMHGEPGRPLGPGFLPDAIKSMARQAGIEKRVHAHGLRHTYASEVIREGHALPVVSRMLGHAGTAITHTYIDHTFSAGEAVDAMKRRGATPSEPQSGADLTAALAELTGRLEALAVGQAEVTARLAALAEREAEEA